MKLIFRTLCVKITVEGSVSESSSPHTQPVIADGCPSPSLVHSVSFCLKGVFLPTAAKYLHIGSHLIVGAFSVLLRGFNLTIISAVRQLLLGFGTIKIITELN